MKIMRALLFCLVCLCLSLTTFAQSISLRFEVTQNVVVNPYLAQSNPYGILFDYSLTNWECIKPGVTNQSAVEIKMYCHLTFKDITNATVGEMESRYQAYFASDSGSVPLTAPAPDPTEGTFGDAIVGVFGARSWAWSLQSQFPTATAVSVTYYATARYYGTTMVYDNWQHPCFSSFECWKQTEPTEAVVYLMP